MLLVITVIRVISISGEKKIAKKEKERERTDEFWQTREGKGERGRKNDGEVHNKMSISHDNAENSRVSHNSSLYT